MSTAPRRATDHLAGRFGRSAAFPVDIMDRGDEYHVAIEIPGVTTQNLDVSVKNDKLQVVATYEAGSTAGRYHRRERPRGTRRRVVRLPEKVDERHVSASYVDGLLMVHLKKRR